VDYGVLRLRAVVHVVVFGRFGLNTSVTRHDHIRPQYDPYRMGASRPVNDRNYNVCGRLRQRKRPYTFVYDRRKHRPGL